MKEKGNSQLDSAPLQPPIVLALRDLTLIFAEVTKRKLLAKGYGGVTTLVTFLPDEFRKKKHFFGESKVPNSKLAESLSVVIHTACDAAVTLVPVVFDLLCEQIFDPDFYLLFESDYQKIFSAPNDSGTPLLCNFITKPEYMGELIKYYRPLLYRELEQRNVVELFEEAKKELKKKKLKEKVLKSPKPKDLKSKLYRTWTREALHIFIQTMCEFEVSFRLNQVKISNNQIPNLAEVLEFVTKWEISGKWEVKPDEENRLAEIRHLMSTTPYATSQKEG
jgi:hypothetical protein